MTVHYSRAKASTLACLTAIAASIALTACGDKSSDTGTAAPTSVVPAAPAAPETTAKAAPAEDAQGGAGDKLNVYIQCFNSTNERAHKAMTRYASWVKDMKAGPTGKEKIVYGTYTVSNSSLADCDKPVLEAAQAAPAMPALDEAGKAYSGAVLAWGKTLAEADTYYSRENYRDDAMAQGKTLHGDMVKRYAAFEAASSKYNQALEEVNDQRQLAQLAEVEKTEGRKFNYWHMATMMSAKQLVNLLEQDSFDVAEATSRLKAYEDNTDSLLAITKQPDSGMPTMGSTLDSELENYRTSAKQRLRRVRDKTPYSEGERMMLNANSGWMIDGSPDKLIKSYNDLIGSSNRMH